MVLASWSEAPAAGLGRSGEAARVLERPRQSLRPAPSTLRGLKVEDLKALTLKGATVEDLAAPTLMGPKVAKVEGLEASTLLKPRIFQQPYPLSSLT